MAKKQLIDAMGLEPARYFRVPGDVLRDRRFSDAERLVILSAWERVASAANTEDHDITVLNAVRAAHEEIERRLNGVHPQNLGNGTTN